MSLLKGFNSQLVIHKPNATPRARFFLFLFCQFHRPNTYASFTNHDSGTRLTDRGRVEEYNPSPIGCLLPFPFGTVVKLLVRPHPPLGPAQHCVSSSALIQPHPSVSFPCTIVKRNHSHLHLGHAAGRRSDPGSRSRYATCAKTSPVVLLASQSRMP